MLFRSGIARLPVAQVSLLALLSPLVAAIAGWLIAAQTFNLGQIVGMVLILGAIRLGRTTYRDDPTRETR